MLMSIISSHSSTRRSSRREIGPIPALLTNTSSLPNRSRASATSAVRSPRRFTSVQAWTTSPPAAAIRIARFLQPVSPARAEDDLRPAFSEEERGRLADPATGAGDCDDLALGS